MNSCLESFFIRKIILVCRQSGSKVCNSDSFMTASEETLAKIKAVTCKSSLSMSTSGGRSPHECLPERCCYSGLCGGVVAITSVEIEEV